MININQTISPEHAALTSYLPLSFETKLRIPRGLAFEVGRDIGALDQILQVLPSQAHAQALVWVGRDHIGK